MTPQQDPTTGDWYDADTGQPIEAPMGPQAPSYNAPETPAAPPVAPAPPAPAPTGTFENPLQATPNAQLAPQGPQKQGYAVDVSTNQFQPDVYNQQAPLRGKRAGEEAQATAAAQNMMGAQAGRMTNAAMGTAEAQDTIAEIESRKADATRMALESRGRLEQRMATAEQLANDITRAEVQQHRGKFEQSVAAVKAMSVDPTLNFTPPELAAVGAAVFAQYFLGAQGIAAPNVQGTIERWTDRYVDNQMEKIQRGERLLDSERAIWDMVRSDAADETDARGRLRALTLAQASTQLEVEAARWASPLALAHGKEAVASVMSAYAAQLAELENGWHDRLLQDKQFIQTKHYQDVSNAIAARHAKVAEDTLAYQKEKDKNKAAEVPRYFFSYPDAQGNRTPIGQPRPGVSDTELQKAADAYGKGRDVLDAVENLRGLLTENGEPLTTAQIAARFQNSDDALTKAAYSQVVLALRNADRQTMGANFTQNEEALLKGQINLPTFFTRVGVKDTLRLLDNVGERQIGLTDNAMDQVLQDPTPDGSYKPWSGSVAPALKEQYRQGKLAHPPVPTEVQTSEGEVGATPDVNPVTGPQSTTPFGEFVKGASPVLGPGMVDAPWVEPLRKVARHAVGQGTSEREEAKKALIRMRDQASKSDDNTRYNAVDAVINMLETNPGQLEMYTRPSNFPE